MIKSPEKQYNAYRVLKVLSNQDYLAIDYHHRYYVLSPLKNRRTTMLRPLTSNNNDARQENSRIIQPKQCIQLDHIHYYVFPTGSAEIVCANAIDVSRFSNEEYLLQFFTAAVRGILRLLLMREAKEVRKYIDIKNAIVSKGFLCLLQLDRGKIYPRSIERSEKLVKKQGDSLRKILENEFKIIKYFGLLLWQIILKTCLVPKSIANEQRNIVMRLLVSMINKEITFEYLQIKLRDQEEKKASSKEKKVKKFNFLVRSDNRYYTQSMNSSNRKTNDRRVDTQAYSRSSIKPYFTRKNRVISQIKTGAQAIYTFSRRIVPQFNISKISKWVHNYQSIENKPTFRSSNSKINQKLAKQTEQAKNKFRKFLDARFTLREETDEISQGLRSKLMSKIERFKTQHRSQNFQTELRQHSFSQNKMEQHSIVQEIEPKKLDFGTQRKDIHLSQNSQVNINENIELNEEMVKYINNQTEYVKDKEESISQQVLKQKQEKVQQQIKETSPVTKLSAEAKAEDMNIQFQQINFQSTVNPHLSKLLDSQRKIDSEVALTQQTVIKQDKTQQYLKRKKIISDSAVNQSDEIEVIKLEKSIPVKQESTHQMAAAPIKKKEKTEQVSCRQLQQSIDQYQQLIGILGHICSKAKLSKSLGAITWQKPVYFLFERFLFEREKFQQALTLGARQITRDPKLIKDQQWDLWLVSQHRKQLMPKIAAENRQIKQAFNAFAARIVKEIKFDRKIEFYIRNRDKNSNAKGIKFRESLSKLTISFVTEVYDTIIDQRINSKETFHFFLDILYGSLIICELDNLLTAPQRVLLSNYQKYSYSLDQINPLIDFIYSLYFQEQQ